MMTKILVVDDDVRIRKMLAAAVCDISDEVLQCGDGKQAQETYDAHVPDLVLMDLRMPELDGIAATQLIMSKHPAAKIIIVTTYESPALRENARSAGACAYVLKEDIAGLRSVILDQLVL